MEVLLGLLRFRGSPGSQSGLVVAQRHGRVQRQEMRLRTVNVDSLIKRGLFVMYVEPWSSNNLAQHWSFCTPLFAAGTMFSVQGKGTKRASHTARGS